MNSPAESHSKSHCERDDPNGIEITVEMIEAGLVEYGSRWLGLRDADDTVAREMLRAAFIRMYRLRPPCQHMTCVRTLLDR
jgi:hypothetical protein